MTYNVHSCRGADGRADPERIARVIAGCGADIIGLQELDVGRKRTGGIDQAAEIARHLRMFSHFHPAFHLEEERYGDAILTTLPSRLVKAGPLPSVGEPRGALWVEIEFGGSRLQVFNTHFGLRRRERLHQANFLLGTEWLGHPDCSGKPAILLGDFNAVPRSQTFRKIAGQMAVSSGRDMKATFPARLPIFRLDHVFHSEGLDIVACDVVRSPEARLASDHLPLLVEFSLRRDWSAQRPHEQQHRHRHDDDEQRQR